MTQQQLEQVTDDPMLELALSYHAQGWPVFPCRSKEEIDEWGEVFNAKTPYTSNGLKGASLNGRIIREWWKRHPDAMVGVPTGSKIDAFVLDVDNKPGGSNGFDWLDEMEAEHGPLPHTRRVKTPNGGLHVFFKYVPGTRNRGALGAGVDIRSEGGYVVAGGSQMADGRRYEWEDPEAPIADAPDWLLDLVVKRDPPPAVVQPYTGTNTAYVNSAVDHELADLANTPQGARNNRLNDAAFSLGTLVGAGALSRDNAESALMSVANQWPNRKLSLGTIRRGLDAGARQPRQIPEPNTHDNDNTRLVDISRMIANGLAKAARKPAKTGAESRHVSEKHTQISDSEAANHNQESAPHADNRTQTTDESPHEPESPIIATPFTWIDPKTLPRREFAYGTHLIRKFVSVTSSPGGLGKTSLSIAEALAMATGRPLLGVKPPKPIRVWLFNAEDPRDEMERRIMAACLHYNIRPDDIAGRLLLDTGREQELVIAIDDKRGVKIQVPIVEAVVEQVKRNRIDVMYIDPFVSTHQVNENDNGAIDKVAKLWAKIADETNIAIDVVHHLRKGRDDKESTVEDSRGAVALLSAARSARVLNRMSAEQATQAGVLPKDRFSYFSVHQGKANLTQMSDALDWRKLVSVPLGNGRGLTKPQDHAGVVTEWQWPGSEEIANGLTADQLAHIKTLVDNADYKEGPRAKNWVGLAVAYALGLDLEEDGTRKRAATILKALMKEGELVKSEEKDPVRRETAVFVRSNLYEVAA